ncbi:MAG: ATP-binding protein, partial [Bacteroidota bacterium]
EYQNYINSDQPPFLTKLPASVMYLPLLSQNKKTFGVIGVHSYCKNVYRDYHMDILKNLAIYMTTALENVHIYDQLKEQNQIIEEKNKEITEGIKELELAKEAAEAANKAKSEFLANMSHELRTPLNGILGYTQIFQLDKSLNTKQKQGINIIHSSGEHLLALINDVLDLSKIEVGKMEVNPIDFNLHLLIGNISAIMKIRAQEKGLEYSIEIDAEVPLMVFADERMIRQIIINLLGNAIKFTDRGKVSLKTTFSRDETREKLVLEVSDTGIGIPSEAQEEIFAPFHQLSYQSRSREGTGLGLSITQKLVKLMGGQLFLHSRPGQGSTFRVQLPLDLSHKPEPSVPVLTEMLINGYLGPNKKLLLVDDKMENLAVLIDTLQPLGFDISIAQNGQEALTKALEIIPDLILLDLVMPMMDGYEASRKIREYPQLQAVKIIAISASVFEKDQILSVEAGCQDFLPKPFSSALLLEKIAEQLQISWTYEEETSWPTQNPIGKVSSNPMSEPIPPSSKISQLYQLAEIGDIQSINRVVELLPPSKFRQEIQALAKGFQMKKIRSFLDKYQASSKND